MSINSGAVLMILAMCLTPLLDGVAKLLGATHEPLFVCFIRYFSAALVACTIAKLRGITISMTVEEMPSQMFRAALMMGAMGAFISALSLVPMAEAVGGFLTAPLISMILAVIFLNEKLTTQRVAGALLGVAGAILIARPGVSLSAGMVLALIGGVLLGAYMTASRAAAKDDEAPVATLAIQCLLGSAMIAPFAFQGGLPAITPGLGLGAVTLGILSAACHFLTLAALNRSEASVLAPVMYFNIVATVIIGYFLFGEVPSAIVVCGLVAIAAGGIISSAPAISMPKLQLSLRYGCSGLFKVRTI